MQARQRVRALAAGAMRRAALLLALVALVAPGVAAAEVSETVVLVLRVSRDGRYNPPLTRALTEFIQQTGTRLARQSDLRAEERKCDDPGCMADVARNNGASVLVGASIDRHGPRERFIQIWLYDVRSGRDQHAKDACDEEDLVERLKSLTGRLVGSLDGPTAAAGGLAIQNPAKGPVPDPNPQRAESLLPLAATRLDAQPRSSEGLATSGSLITKDDVRSLEKNGGAARPAWRKRLGAGLITLSVLALGASIALTVLDGSQADGFCAAKAGFRSGCRSGYMPLFVPGYALAGASAVGAALSLGLR